MFFKGFQIMLDYYPSRGSTKNLENSTVFEERKYNYPFQGIYHLA